MSSIEISAEQVIAKWKRDAGKVVKWEQMQADIEQALRDERERAAKILEARAKQLGRMALAPLLDDETVARFRSQSAVCHELTAIIRKGD